MSWNIVRLDEVASTPWKNGGGTTRELIAWPNSEQWVWRMSVAEVKEGGPFSSFPGVQRWFSVLSGASVTLDVNHAGQYSSHLLKRDSTPFCFDGEAAVNCELLEGVTHDLNLMLYKNQALGRMQRITGKYKFCAKATAVTQAKKMVAIYANDKSNVFEYVKGSFVSIRLPAHTLAWKFIPVDIEIQLESPDALLMEICHYV